MPHIHVGPRAAATRAALTGSMPGCGSVFGNRTARNSPSASYTALYSEPSAGQLFCHMKPPLLCPTCHGELDSQDRCPICHFHASMRDGVHGFVADGYADSFGSQWQEFARTQLDSANGTTISEARFADLTGWTADDLRGRTVLDAGCGAGRFTEIAIRSGANVTAVDLSSAVYAARANVDGAERARFVQASVFALPLPERSFDYVFSIGVAQHTPDPLNFVRCVAKMVRPGGRAALWIYERTLKALLRPKYILRPITRRLPQPWNRRLVTGLVGAFFPIAQTLSRLPRPLRQVIRGSLPIATYLERSDIPSEMQRDWSLLDTLDWYSPAHDHPQRFLDVAHALREGGALEVERRSPPGITVSARF
jgi:2-polyprenyl-3-methyl-5-hydroxy-6-metoxy-1,4-benzoquinol methylase